MWPGHGARGLTFSAFRAGVGHGPCGAAERSRRGGSRSSLSNSLKSPVAKNIFYLDIYF